MTIRFWLGTAVLLSVLLLVWADNIPPAGAHDLSDNGHTHVADDLCVTGELRLTHGDGYGGWSATTRASRDNWYGSDCASSYVKPRNDIRLHVVLQRWNGSSWTTCHRSPVYTNRSSASWVGWSHSYTTADYNACGGYGYYRATSLHQVWHEGRWIGGDTWRTSPWHVFKS